MNARATVQTQNTARAILTPTGYSVLQRACGCGQHTGSGGECDECKKKREGMLQRTAIRSSSFISQNHKAKILQTKLAINKPGDEYEQEADRIADQVMAASVNQSLSNTSPRIQRFTGQPTGQMEMAPASVDQVLASPGSPLEPALRNDMEQRFGYDFSQVRVHSNTNAEQSARNVNAHAYTVGRDIVFGTGRFAPEMHEGRLLIAHELTHVIQQGMARSVTEPYVSRHINASASTAPMHSNFESGIQSAFRLMRQPSETSETFEQSAQNAETEIDCPDNPPNRAEEIKISRVSPGGVAGETAPLALSLFNFAIDSSTPKPEHIAILDELASLLNTYARGQVRAHLVGNTDCTGRTGHNIRLSERRACAVRDVLTPLLSSRVGISWVGELHPVASNTTAEGRSRNRRVDVRFVSSISPVPNSPTPRPKPDRKDDDHPDSDECPWFLPLLCSGLGLPWLLPLICFIDPALCIPPVFPPPPRPPRPDKPDKPPRTPQVMFVPDVRAANTPRGMNDRISNATPMTITAVVTNLPPAGQSILIEVDGVGPQAGDATIDGAHRIQINDTTTIRVQGTVLTAPRLSAPRLQLGAWFAGGLVGASNEFSVSAIMQDWETEFEDAKEFPMGFDLYAKMHWASDGISIRDLSECHHVELVGVDREEGAMRGMGIGRVKDPDDPDLGDIMPGYDTHGTERRWLTGPGFQRLHQLYQMRDTRSNSDWVPSRNSGFHIDRIYERDSENPLCWQLTVEKVGDAVNIGGISAEAGSGKARHVWHRINCASPPQEEPPGPTPVPDVQPPPMPGPDEPPPVPQPECDQAELARRVDQCIEEAKQDAIECTLLLAVPGIGGPIGKGIEYYICIREMRDRLLECDRRAKEDTNCIAAIREEDLQSDFEQCMNEQYVPVPAGAQEATEANQKALEECYQRTGYRKN
jgi:outer membrane protein OmpA-like peptidoglycan-associated protein